MRRGPRRGAHVRPARLGPPRGVSTVSVRIEIAARLDEKALCSLLVMYSMFDVTRVAVGRGAQPAISTYVSVHGRASGYYSTLLVHACVFTFVIAADGTLSPACQ